MSTLKVNNLQVGQDSTATNNLTWFQPGSPDGTIRLGSGNAGSATTKFTFDKDGNLTCVGTITATSIEGTIDDWIVHLGDTDTKYGFPAANTYSIETGGSERLRVDSNGNIGVNCDSPTNISNSRGITIQGASSTPAGFINFMDSADNSDARILADNGVLTITADPSDNTASSAIALNVDGTSEKLRIHSTGQVEFKNGSFSNNVNCVMASGSTLTVGATASIKFRTATNQVLLIDSNGLISNRNRSSSDYGSPQLLIGGGSSTLTMMGDGSTNNSSYTGIKFRVAGTSTGDYTKAALFAQRQGGYNDLALIFALDTVADASSVAIADEKVRITSAGRLGIGDDNPQSLLSLKGSNPTIRFTDGSTLVGGIEGDTTQNTFYGYNNADLVFSTTSGASYAQRLRITTTGSVNIGGDYSQTSKMFKVTGNTTLDGGLHVTGLLEGGSGFSIINGNLTLPAYTYHDADSDTYYGFSGADEFSIFTGGAQRLRVQSDGNIRWFPDGSNGVNLYATSGTSSIVLAAYKNGSAATSLAFKNQNSSGQAKTWMEVNGDQQISIPYGMGGTDFLNVYVAANVTKGINIMGQDGGNQNSDSGRIHFNGYAQTNGPWIWGENTLSYGKKDLVFGTTSTTNDYTTEVGETLRLTKYGDVQFGIDANNTLWDSNNNEQGLYYRRSEGSFAMATRSSTGYSNWYMNKNNSGGGSDVRWIDFYWNQNQVGRISFNGASGTSFGTSSDYRLKENVVSITDGIAKVKQLKPYRFNFKSDTTDTVVQGFFAHEAQDVVPYAVTGTKDEVVTQAAFDAGIQPEENPVGTPIYQDVDYAKFTPILTAALQEAISKIEVLEAKVAALESS